jgi:predicted site-specific integrase-resolvase
MSIALQPALVSTREAMQILGTDRKTTIDWGRAGRIEIVYQAPGGNGVLMFDRDSVERLAATIKNNATAAAVRKAAQRRVNAAVAANIRAQLGCHKDKTQAGIAQVLGMSRQTISNRLSNRQSWTAAELAKIADYLRVPISELVPAEEDAEVAS